MKRGCNERWEDWHYETIVLKREKDDWGGKRL